MGHPSAGSPRSKSPRPVIHLISNSEVLAERMMAMQLPMRFKDYDHTAQPRTYEENSRVPDLSMAPAVEDGVHSQRIRDHFVQALSPLQQNLGPQLSQDELKQHPLPAHLRPGFGEMGTKCTVSSNHFPLNVSPDLELYQYIVTIRAVPMEKSFRTWELTKIEKKYVFSTFLRSYPALVAKKGQLATDFKQTILTWEPLSEDANFNLCYAFSLAPRSKDVLSTRRASVQIKFGKIIKLKDLLNHSERDMKVKAASFDPQQASHALSVIISRLLELNYSYAVSAPTEEVGAGKFLSVTDWAKVPGVLEDILRLNRGFQMTIVPGMGRPLLRVNTASVMCYRSQLVSKVLNADRDSNFNNAKKSLFGLIVRIESHRKSLDHPTESHRIIVGFGESNPTWVERGKGRRGKVQHMRAFLAHKHHWEDLLDEKSPYNDYPAVNIGTLKQPEWFPSEKLTVLPYQVTRNPSTNEDLHNEMRNFAVRMNSEYMGLISHFMTNHMGRSAGSDSLLIPGLELKASLVRSDARLLTAPKISYDVQSSQTPTVKNGGWKLSSGRLSRAYPEEFTIGIIHAHGVAPKEDLENLSKKLIDKLLQFGLKPARTAEFFPTPLDSKTLNYNLGLAKEKCGLFILLLEKKQPGSRIYAEFKRLADTEHGVPSICMTLSGSGTHHRNNAYINSVALKVNTRFANSFNHLVDGVAISSTQDVRDKMMILGGSLTHPGCAAFPGTPSVAALVASIDDDSASHYRGAINLQISKKGDKGKEIIQNMRVLAKAQLEFYGTANGRLPKRIIYYRHGLSDSQLRQFNVSDDVLESCPKNDFRKKEIEEIAEACREVLAKASDTKDKTSLPKITVILVRKQNKLRFSPRDRVCLDEKMGNCRVGTVVDSGVTSPWFHDFYLQSHSVSKDEMTGVSGTARPTHYLVVHDDNNLSADQVQQLSFQLCFTSQIATHSLAMPTPLYYAKRLATRGRKHLDGFLEGDCDRFFEKLPATVAQMKVFGHDKAKIAAHMRELKPEAVFKICEDNMLRAGHGSNGPWSAALDQTMFWL